MNNSATYHKEYRQRNAEKIRARDRARKAGLPKPTSDTVEAKQADTSKETPRPCAHKNAGENGSCKEPGILRRLMPVNVNGKLEESHLTLCWSHRYHYGSSSPVHGETQSPYEGVPVVYPRA